MAVVDKSSSDTAIGSEANSPINSGVLASSDTAFGSETWQVQKGTAWSYAYPYSVVIDEPSHVSVVIDDLDPYDFER